MTLASEIVDVLDDLKGHNQGHPVFVHGHGLSKTRSDDDGLFSSSPNTWIGAVKSR